MVKRVSILLTLVVAFLAVAAPITAVIFLAREQGIDAEKSRAIEYATDALSRSEQTADAFLQIAEYLSARVKGDPCSPENIDLLEYIQLASSKVQALGYLSGNHFACSTIGSVIQQVDLGSPYVSGPGSLSVRADVSFPELTGVKFVVLEKNGFAAVIHELVPLSTSTEGSDIVLSTINVTNHSVLVTKGVVDTRWFDVLPAQGASRAYIDNGYVVALVRSSRLDIASVAAIPISYLNTKSRELMLHLIPIGSLAGVILAIAILYLSRQQMALPQSIRAALRRDEFYLLYQPIVDLRTGRWIGAEALMRWRRGKGEMVSPDIFISVAEKTGLIKLITRRLLEIVGRDMSNFFARYPDFHVALNLSAEDIHDQEVIEQFQELKKKTRAATGNLMIEVTERALTRPELARDVIRKLREIGITTAVDDFGTGYSSLSYVGSFDLDILKIDKTFVDTIDMDEEIATRKVILHIVEMAKSLKLKMIAEGVETESQREFLIANGVEYGQGWLFSKPLTLVELLDGLRARA